MANQLNIGSGLIIMERRDRGVREFAEIMIVGFGFVVTSATATHDDDGVVPTCMLLIYDIVIPYSPILDAMKYCAIDDDVGL